MSEESTTPDLVELTRRAFEAASGHDLDALMSFFAPDVVWDLSALGIGTFTGAVASRSFIGDWWETWADHLIELDEIVDLGNGVVFSSAREDGRLAGSDRHVEQRTRWVFLWMQDVIERATVYLDIDEARAAAERLAESRRWAMSEENVEIVRQAVAAINDRDVERYLALCAPDVELISPVAAIEGASVGAGGIREFFAGVDEAASEFHLQVESLDQLPDGRVLASLHVRMESRGGVALTQPIFNVYALAGGKLSRVEVFSDHAAALEALGLSE
jgi:ketosteroid isomerase-like protein